MYWTCHVLFVMVLDLIVFMFVDYFFMFETCELCWNFLFVLLEINVMLDLIVLLENIVMLDLICCWKLL